WSSDVCSSDLPFGRRPSREEGLISMITNGNILYLVTFKWLLAGAYGLPHTFNALTQYISYFNCLVYNVFLLSFFFFHLKILGGAVPLRPVLTHRHCVCVYCCVFSKTRLKLSFQKEFSAFCKSKRILLLSPHSTLSEHAHTESCTHREMTKHTHTHTHILTGRYDNTHTHIYWLAEIYDNTHTHTRTYTHTHIHKIGRASCRERVYISVGAVTIEKKKHTVVQRVHEHVCA